MNSLVPTHIDYKLSKMVADSPINVVPASASPVNMVASTNVGVNISKAIILILKPTTSLLNEVVDFSMYFVPSNKAQ